MTANDFNDYFPTWCPGCGDYGIWASLKEALVKLGLEADQFVIVFGIGCSGNMNDFIKCYGFHSLHGRAIPTAKGINLANHKLPIIVIGGDGDLYGEGGNHFLHACRGNFNITVIIHNNEVYGLTTGQVSPTAHKGQPSKSTPSGIIEVPVNPLSLAISQGATFVAQGFAGDIPELTRIMVEAVKHKGFSIVNVLQPCVTFNKNHSYQWYRERVYKLDSSYDKAKIEEAIGKAMETEKLATGIIYQVSKSTYDENLPQLKKEPLIGKSLKVEIKNLLEEFY